MHRSISLVAAALAGLTAVIAVASCTAIDGRSGRTGLTSETTAAVETIAETSGAFSPPPVTPMRRVAAGSTEPAPGELEAMARRSADAFLERMEEAGLVRSSGVVARRVRLIHDQQWETTDTLEVQVEYPRIAVRVNAASALVESYEASSSLILPKRRPAYGGQALETVRPLLRTLLADRLDGFQLVAQPNPAVDGTGRHFFVGGERFLDELPTRDFLSARLDEDGRMTSLRLRWRTRVDRRPIRSPGEVLRKLRDELGIGPQVTMTADLEYWVPDVLPGPRFYNGKVYRVSSSQANWRTGWWGIVDASTGEVVEVTPVD